MYETIHISGVENHPAKHVYEMMSDIVSDVCNWDVDLISILSGPDGTGLTLEMSDAADDLIRDGNLPFTLERHLEGYFGDSTGSSNVTSVRLEEQMNVRDVIEVLSQTGQLEEALRVVDMYREENDPEPEVILTYALAQYAKGWLAEEYVTQQEWSDTEGIDGAKKGSVSQDKGGIDFYLNGDMAQLGSITRYNSKKKQMEQSDIRHILYQWDSDGTLHVGDMREMVDEVNHQIADRAGLSATLIRRSAENLKINKQLGRSFRYLWW